MRTTINYKGHEIKKNSEHRYYVNRFNDEYDGVVMFTTEDRAKAYIDKHLMKVFEQIDLDIQEVCEFIEKNKLSFICNDKMQVESSVEDFNRLIAEFPYLDYVEAEQGNR